MPNFNPRFPDILGLEYFATQQQLSRVFSGSPGRMQRMPSTVTQTVSALKMSAEVNDLLKEDTRTVVDVIVEGNETTPLFTPQFLVPNSDVTVNNWRRKGGASTGLFNALDSSATQWPGPAQFDYITNHTSEQNYECTVDASAFDSGGSYENGRIGFVQVDAIYAANTGFRKLRTRLNLGGTLYAPAGGSLRDVHGFGARYTFWWGELNPATGKPWTPADIAAFDVGGTNRLNIRTYIATPDNHPRAHALSLTVWAVPTENRVAVGVWRRPQTLSSRLVEATTDALITVPSGAANWAKQTGVNYLLYWRQSVSPALFGNVNADDVRWKGSFQDLGPAGEPPGIVFPLHHSGTDPAVSASDISSALVAYDQFGRPTNSFADASRSRATYAIAPIVSGAPSVDSQPYRLDITDLTTLRSGKNVAQRLTPGSSQTYIGVRFPIIPPATATGTLTVTVRRVSDDVQIGGSFAISAAAVRAIEAGAGGVRYVEGNLSSGAALVGGTAYRIRLSTDITTQDWITFTPDCSLAPTTSFGGTTGGLEINNVLDSNQDLAITLTKQPDPPTSPTAAITNVAVNKATGCGVTQVQHVLVDWVAPSSSLGVNFRRYEVERQISGETTWTRIYHVNLEIVTDIIDRLVPRNTTVLYRIRAVALDGRFSAWATTGTVTPNPTDAEIILTSNHQPDLEVVYDYDPESSYTILSTERDEVIPLHGVDYQAVFMEAEDRGVGWQTGIVINFGDTCPPSLKGGLGLFDPLLALVRSQDIPFVAALDHQGSKILGHVTPSQATQQQPFHRYTAQISVIPTHVVEVPVEVVST